MTYDFSFMPVSDATTVSPGTQSVPLTSMTPDVSERSMAPSFDAEGRDQAAVELFASDASGLVQPLLENAALAEALKAIVDSFSGEKVSLAPTVVAEESHTELRPEAVVVENLLPAAKAEPVVVDRSVVVEKKIVESPVVETKPAAVVVEAPVVEAKSTAVVVETPVSVEAKSAAVVVEAPVSVEAKSAAVVVEAPVSVEAKSAAVVVEAPVSVEAKPAAVVAGTSVAVENPIVEASVVEAKPAALVVEAPVSVEAKSAAVVVEAPVSGEAKSAAVVVDTSVAVEKPTVEAKPVDRDRQSLANVASSDETDAASVIAAAEKVIVEVPVATVAPTVSPTAETVVAVPAVESVAAAAALSPTETVIAAASAVADAMYVTPGQVMGDGEVVVQLRPDVLDGSAVKIVVTGNQVEVAFTPSTPEAAQALTANVGGLQAHLAQAVPAYDFGIVIAAAQTQGVAAAVAQAVVGTTVAGGRGAAGSPSNRKRI